MVCRGGIGGGFRAAVGTVPREPHLTSNLTRPWPRLCTRPVRVGVTFRRFAIFLTCVALALVAEGVHPPNDNKTCVFLVTTPGSGSSTMVEYLNQFSSCEISGENWDALHDLAKFDSDLDRTDRQNRRESHDAAAWRKVYSRPAVDRAEAAMIQALFNPNDAPCWGFKEIRFARGLDHCSTFQRDMAYLRSLCARPRIIIHTRRDIAREMQSKIVSQDDGRKARTTIQWACFETILGNASAASARGLSKNAVQQIQEGCSPSSDVRASQIFRHTLEDYLEDNANHNALWKYLGMDRPMADAGARIHLNGTG